MKLWSKRVLFFALAMTAIAVQAVEEKKDYPLKPVPFTKVQINDAFWSPRIDTNRKVTIPFAFKKCEETGRIDNFSKASGLMRGKHEGKRYNDSDVFKIIEGASYSLSLYPDPELEKYLDGLIAKIASAQEPDGYLYTARTIDPENPAAGAGEKRWINLNGSHELYNVGHLYEAAVAHSLATGKHSLLDVALKNADLLLKIFGPDRKHDVPGHQEIEIGLAKLYRLTGNKDYLNLAKFFLDERGQPHESRPYPESSPFAIYNQTEYKQDHRPVLEQEEAVGHAVRAAYMYSGMADVAALTGNLDYTRAIDRIWENVVSKKIYLTGGIGSRHTSEAFGANYELPNLSAYTETCAAIGNAFWNHRLFLLHGEAKYLDLLERILYNGLISGVSLSGDLFFYQNPLESRGRYERSPWFEVACCPGNIVRFLPSFPGYVYAQEDDTVFINLFVSSTARLEVKNNSVVIKQETLYPWEGAVKVSIDPEKKDEFAVYVRIPGWAQNQPVPSDLYHYLDRSEERVAIKVNGKAAPFVLDKGFARIRRTWKKGDVIDLDLPMPIRRVLCQEKVTDNTDKVALERGPIVYCLEWADNGGRVLDLLLPDKAELKSEYRKNLLGGVTVIKGKAARLPEQEHGKSVSRESVEFTAIPYYAWAQRGQGEMAVWILRQKAKD